VGSHCQNNANRRLQFNRGVQTLRYKTILGRRLAKLESVIEIPSQEEKSGALQAEALTLMTLADLPVMREVAALAEVGSEVEQTLLETGAADGRS
jgi:hypothetical protein